MIRKFKTLPPEDTANFGEAGQRVKILRWGTNGPRRIKPAAEADPRFTLPLEKRRLSGS